MLLFSDLWRNDPCWLHPGNQGKWKEWQRRTDHPSSITHWGPTQVFLSDYGCSISKIIIRGGAKIAYVGIRFRYKVYVGNSCPILTSDSHIWFWHKIKIWSFTILGGGGVAFVYYFPWWNANALKGLFTIFFQSFKSHIFDSNGVWYNWLFVRFVRHPSHP